MIAGLDTMLLCKNTILAKHNKQIAILFASSILGLLFGALNSVINTRALDPAQYGDVRFVQNIISFVSSLLLLGYFVSGSRLLAISKDEQLSRRLRGVMCMILAITTLVVMLVMTAMYAYSQITGAENMIPLYLAAIPVCGNVLMLNYVNTVCQGDNHIGRIAFGRLLPSFLYCIIAYAIFHVFGASPVLMLLLFNGISVIVLGWIILSTKPSFSGIRESFHLLNNENKSYGFDVYIGSLANVSTGYLSGITLGWFCETNAEVGFYTLALTLATPLSMLPSIIGTTYFKRFASQDKIDRKVFISSIVLTLSSLIIFLISIRFIVEFLYNEKYYSVTIYSSFLALGMSIHGFGDMINRFLGAHGQGKMLRNSAFMSGAVITAGSFFFVYFWEISGAILTKCLGSVIYLLTMIVYYRIYTSTRKNHFYDSIG